MSWAEYRLLLISDTFTMSVQSLGLFYSTKPHNFRTAERKFFLLSCKLDHEPDLKR